MCFRYHFNGIFLLSFCSGLICTWNAFNYEKVINIYLVLLMSHIIRQNCLYANELLMNYLPISLNTNRIEGIWNVNKTQLWLQCVENYFYSMIISANTYLSYFLHLDANPNPFHQSHSSYSGNMWFLRTSKMEIKQQTNRVIWKQYLFITLNHTVFVARKFLF